MRYKFATTVIACMLAFPVTADEKQVFWGDLHLHSSMSFDAFINGARLVGPEEAFRFARGEAVTSNTGTRAQLHRPLDFLALADHSENLGLFNLLQKQDPRIYGQTIGDRYGEVLSLFEKVGLRNAFMEVMKKHGRMPVMEEGTAQEIWSDFIAVADKFNSPGTFSTLLAYEWTGMVTGDNLHRVVLFRDGAEKVRKMLPLNATQYPDPEQLWDWLLRYQESTNGKVMAIAHNGNLSNGRMFAPVRVNGKPFDQNYVEKRQRWEPVYEVSQVKGDGEAHPKLSPNDQFADFETWDRGNVAATKAKEDSMLRFEYARNALIDGLGFEQSLGTNPFKFGMVGGTDIHTGLSTVEEDNFYGKFAGSEPSADRMFTKMGGQFDDNVLLGAQGLTAVWAMENTREAIFDAIERREVYATTGTRIKLKLMAGWESSTLTVPMGRDFPVRNANDSPAIQITVQQDPEGQMLQRVQVIKGWINTQGQSQEKIYDLAISDTGTTGFQLLWIDPEFDAQLPSMYYVRVLEMPSPRWSKFDSNKFSVEHPSSVPASIQERAYSSPVWYRPSL